MGFYTEGFGGIEEEAARQEEERARGGARRVWLPPLKHGRVVFLDSQPFRINEHALLMNGHYRNWYTCIAGINKQGCPLDKNSKPYHIGFFTIVDVKPWTDKKGVVHKNLKRLLGLKTSELVKLNEKCKLQAEAIGATDFDLRGTEWDIFRSGPKVSSSGDDFTLIRRHEDLTVLFKDELSREAWKDGLEHFEYRTLFEPRKYEDLLQLRAASKVEAEGDGTPTDAGEAAPDAPLDEIPF